MSEGATVVSGFLPYIGFMIKDVASRLVILSHNSRITTDMYPMMRHQAVRAYRGMLPWTQDAAFIAPSAHICGNVGLGHDTCVYYHTVIRNYSVKVPTVIGDETVLMDRVSLMGQVRVGGRSYIGIGATLDCCHISDEAYVGPGASVALGATVERHAFVAAGAAVRKDARVNSGELWAGNPAQKVGEVTPEQVAQLGRIIQDAIDAAKAHKGAIEEHVKRSKNLNEEWLSEMVQLMEKQQNQVALKVPVEIPLEARRFLQPRVHMRRIEVHANQIYPVNRIAPWMPRIPDQTGNS